MERPTVMKTMSLRSQRRFFVFFSPLVLFFFLFSQVSYAADLYFKVTENNPQVTFSADGALPITGNAVTSSSSSIDFLSSNGLSPASGTSWKENVTMTLNGGVTVTNQLSAALHFDGLENADLSKLQVSYAFNSLDEAAYTSWQNLSEDMTLQLPGWEGMNYVNLRIRDDEGNMQWLWERVEYDSYAPYVEAVLAGGANQVADGLMSVDLTVIDSGTGPYKMRYRRGTHEDWSGWVDYQNHFQVDNWGLDGTRYVLVEVMDKAGNISWTAYDSVELAARPLLAQAYLEENAAATNNGNMSVKFTVNRNSNESVWLRYRRGTHEEWSGWTQLNRSDSGGYSEGTFNLDNWGLDGVRYLLFQMKDAEGRMSEISYDTILLDTKAPVGTMTVNGGASSFTASDEVTLAFNASDEGSGIVEMSYAFNSLDESAFSAWEPYTATKKIKLPGFSGANYINVRLKDAAGNVTTLWQVMLYEPAYASLTDYLIGVSTDYFDPRFGMVEATHEYPVEGFGFEEYTQPTNFGFYAEYLATVAAGEIHSAFITAEQALVKLNRLMDHLLIDQEQLGYKGLLPWMLFDGTDWKRRGNDIYGQQVSFEDNSNLAVALGLAYGALLHSSLNGNAQVYGADGQEGLLEKMDRFLDNQKQGYACLYDASRGEFHRSMTISDGVTTCGENGTAAPNFSGGFVDYFGAESRSPVLFLSLLYQDVIPSRVYEDLAVVEKTHTLSTGETVKVASPFQGAFQMLWPSLLMPESSNADLNAMLTDYVDLLLDYSKQNNIPGFLSSSYDVKPAGDLLRGNDNLFTFGDASGSWSDTGWHMTSSNHSWDGTAFIQENMDLSGNTLELAYRTTTELSDARLELKRDRNGEVIVITSIPLELINTHGAEGKVTISLDSLGVDVSDVDQMVLVLNTAPGQTLDFTVTALTPAKPVFRAFYSSAVGIQDIALSAECCSVQPASLYTLGAAALYRPDEVKEFITQILIQHPELVTDHGLWEGINTQYNRVINKQILANVLTFVFGISGKTSEHMLRFLEANGLKDDLEERWSPSAPIYVDDRSVEVNFQYNGFYGTAFQMGVSTILSGRQLKLNYTSQTALEGLTVEFKHENSSVAAYRMTFNLPAAPSGHYVLIDLPEDFSLWHIREITFLSPELLGPLGDILQSVWIVG